MYILAKVFEMLRLFLLVESISCVRTKLKMVVEMTHQQSLQNKKKNE